MNMMTSLYNKSDISAGPSSGPTLMQSFIFALGEGMWVISENKPGKLEIDFQ